MHRDSCAEHIGLFRQYGGEVFVAELDHKVVGHIEVTIDANRSISEYVCIHKCFDGAQRLPWKRSRKKIG